MPLWSVKHTHTHTQLLVICDYFHGFPSSLSPARVSLSRWWIFDVLGWLWSRAQTVVTEGFSVYHLGSCIGQTGHLLLPHLKIMKLLNCPRKTGSTREISLNLCQHQDCEGFITYYSVLYTFLSLLVIESRRALPTCRRYFKVKIKLTIVFFQRIYEDSNPGQRISWSCHYRQLDWTRFFSILDILSAFCVDKIIWGRLVMILWSFLKLTKLWHLLSYFYFQFWTYLAKIEKNILTVSLAVAFVGC